MYYVYTCPITGPTVNRSNCEPRPEEEDSSAVIFYFCRNVGDVPQRNMWKHGAMFHGSLFLQYRVFLITFNNLFS